MEISEYIITGLTADALAGRLTSLARARQVCLLDSCGAPHLGSRLLIAGVGPRHVAELSDGNPASTLAAFDELLARPGQFCFFTISYDFGLALHALASRFGRNLEEPDVFVALFDAVVVHDYVSGTTRAIGQSNAARQLAEMIMDAGDERPSETDSRTCIVKSDATRADFMERVGRIHEHIRDGITYQTNLTHKLRAELPAETDPAAVFARLRRSHPAPFAAFMQRPGSTVVSASPERFFRIDDAGSGRRISTSPIKGTRPRGVDPADDERLRRELAESEKDRAENVMIVDLLRNDLGRVCEFGSVEVVSLCAVEEHPSLFHLVSTVEGTLRPEIGFSDVIRAVFPCGSITGAPKISTMRVIDELEKAPRGLSMGAIGFARGNWTGTSRALALLPAIDTSVAIRTMTVRDGVAEFAVGGGIVIDSDPATEWEETLTKARALLGALGGRLEIAGNKVSPSASKAP